MKKRILIPYAHKEKLAWVQEYFPDRSVMALPVAGKTLLEYWLDECRRDGVEAAMVLDWEYDEQLAKTVGNGWRWALDFKYHGYPEYAGDAALKKQYAAFFADGEVEVQLGWTLAGADLDSLQSWFDLNFALLDSPGRYVLPGYSVHGGLRTGMNAEIDETDEISGNAYVGDGAQISADCRLHDGAIVGRDCIIGEGCEIAHSVVMDNTSVGDNLELSGKVVYHHRIIDPASGTFADIEEDSIASGTDGTHIPGAEGEAEFLGHRFTASEDTRTERKLARTLAEMSREIASLHLPFLRGVYLGGGYGRGEGAAPLANDLDLFVLVDKADTAQKAMVATALEAIGMHHETECGIHVDFCRPKSEADFRKDEKRLMIQELVRGYATVWGDPDGLAFLHRFPANELPAMEAVRLLVNRGMGLAFARDYGKSEEFRDRNVNKAVLGSYDAELIARGRYEWRAADRAEALNEPVYRKALECKAHGRGAATPWVGARDLWVHAADETLRLHKEELRDRRLRHAVRWMARRRTFGIEGFGLDPLMRIMRPLRRILAEAPAEGRLDLPQSLIKDWKVFN